MSDLKAKLKERIATKKLSRTSRVIRDKRAEKLEEKLEQKNISVAEKRKIKRELSLLDEIEDKELSAIHTYETSES
jgi:hypothetical protein